MKTIQIVRKLGGLWEQASGRSFVFRYSIATGFVLLAFAARTSLDPILHSELSFTFFITSSILAAFFGGFGAGLYAMITGWLLADYFFVPPVGSIGGYGKLEFISLLSDFGPAIFALLLIEFLHYSRRKARREVEARKLTESELSQAKQKLEENNAALESRVAERTAELQESIRFLEGFCYSIAHDLRAPLRAMQGFAFALDEEYTNHLDTTGKEYGNRIIKASQRMDKLLLDLLEYGRLSHSGLTIREIVTEGVIDHVVDRLKPVVGEKGAEIKIQRPLLNVQADALLLELILFHLIDNGLKFTRSGNKPLIELSTQDRGGFVRILVRDNGVGIEPRHQERIFRLFETLTPPSTMTTGAGLALVRKSVERMKGRLGVESQPGMGSTFWIELLKPAERKSPQDKVLIAH
jgi:signal transduction histidine kinase